MGFREGSGSEYGKDTSTFKAPSLFFSREVQRDVAICHRYVSRADEFVDAKVQDPDSLARFEEKTKQGILDGTVSNNPDIDKFVELSRRTDIPLEDIQKFFYSMRLDITKHSYMSYQELKKEYFPGVAESVAVMMCRIIGVGDEALPPARAMARSFQLANITRDIREDLGLGRVYIPQEDIQSVGLPELSPLYGSTPEFARLIEIQQDRYYDERRSGWEGLKYLPKRSAVAVASASEAYTATMRTIQKNPEVVFDRRVRPSTTEKLMGVGKAFGGVLFQRPLSQGK